MLSLRPITPEDEGFLFRVYAESRQREMAMVDWTDEEKEAFLRMQFEAQRRYYREHFSGAAFDIVLLDEKPIGRLYVQRREDEIRIIDIALLAAYRRQGLGSALLEEILIAAGDAALPVRIHVERDNPALSLYARLGFLPIAERGVYYLMEWNPAQAE